MLPQSWTSKKIEEEFGVTIYMARPVKTLLICERGVLSTPNPKPGKTLSKDTVQVVEDFYQENDISRIMPGKTVTIRGNRD